MQSFLVILTGIGEREVVLRQQANLGFVELLTRAGAQVPHGDP